MNISSLKIISHKNRTGIPRSWSHIQILLEKDSLSILEIIQGEDDIFKRNHFERTHFHAKELYLNTQKQKRQQKKFLSKK